MLKKVALVAAAASSAFIALPAAANAQSYGYYDGGRYDRNYRGDRYRGEMRDGVSSGLGVYEFGSNPNNTGGATRYEGEHVRGGASGYGVTYWRNGDNFAGQETSASGQARGVFTFANGQKYEGELRDGTRNGYGVVWAPDGTLLAAGRWANGDLVEPVTPAGQ